MKNSRKLKIHTKYQPRTYKGINVSEIILQGKWLESLGFMQGKMVVVKEEKNKLTITVDKSN